MEVKELEIPVPWGHVSAKGWGNQDNILVLTIHGGGDNAASFDRLIPFLPPSFFYLCIDLPGHGKSSYAPPYLVVSSFNSLLMIKLIVKYFNRTKFILMGHSWGGQLAVMYTHLYPDSVLKLIMLDSFHVNTANEFTFKPYLRENIDAMIRINQNVAKKKQPTYTYEQALQKFIDNRLAAGLFKEAAEPVLKRALVPAENGKVKFSTDPRMRLFFNTMFDIKYLVEIVNHNPITCPILFLYASDLSYYYFESVVKELQKYNKHCIIQNFLGTHDLHNNHPKVASIVISNFLLYYSSSKM